MEVPAGSRSVHYAQHREAVRFQESPNQQRRKNEKGDVEPGCVVPCDGRLNHARVTLSRDETKSPEYQFNNKCGTRHCGVESDEQESGHLQPVILAIDVQDRENDKISEDERDDATETDAAIPEHSSQRNVPDRAYERDD